MEAPAQTTQYSAVRAPGREHIPLFPKGFITIRILQLIFGVIVLGLGAFGVWWSAGLLDGPIFILVVGLFTLITSIYHLVAEYGAPSIYNYWAVLSLDIFMVIMWLSSFALLASQVAALFSYSYMDSWGYIYGLGKGDKIVVSCLAAASALGGVEFLLHIISLVLTGVNLHRHRAAGLHCMPRAPGAPAPAAPAPAAAVAAPVAPGAEKQTAYQQVAPQPTPSPAPAYIQAYPVQNVQAQPQPQFQAQPQYQQPQPQYQQPQPQYFPQQVIQQPQATQLPTGPQ